MKTTCHCVFCPRHPKHKLRSRLHTITNFEPGKFIPHDDGAADVDCLKPISQAFVEFDIDPESERFPETAYGDGQAMTGFHRSGVTLFASCGNETYVP